MDLQTTFYTLGIVFYVLSILILLGIAIGVLLLYRKVNQLYKEVDNKIAAFKEITSHPAGFAASMGAAVAHSAIKGVGKLMEGKRRK